MPKVTNYEQKIHEYMPGQNPDRIREPNFGNASGEILGGQLTHDASSLASSVNSVNEVANYGANQYAQQQNASMLHQGMQQAHQIGQVGQAVAAGVGFIADKIHASRVLAANAARQAQAITNSTAANAAINTARQEAQKIQNQTFQNPDAADYSQAGETAFKKNTAAPYDQQQATLAAQLRGKDPSGKAMEEFVKARQNDATEYAGTFNEYNNKTQAVRATNTYLQGKAQVTANLDGSTQSLQNAQKAYVNQADPGGTPMVKLAALAGIHGDALRKAHQELAEDNADLKLGQLRAVVTYDANANNDMRKSALTQMSDAIVFINDVQNAGAYYYMDPAKQKAAISQAETVINTARTKYERQAVVDDHAQEMEANKLGLNATKQLGTANYAPALNQARTVLQGAISTEEAKPTASSGSPMTNAQGMPIDYANNTKLNVLKSYLRDVDTRLDRASESAKQMAALQYHELDEQQKVDMVNRQVQAEQLISNARYQHANEAKFISARANYVNALANLDAFKITGAGSVVSTNAKGKESTKLTQNFTTMDEVLAYAQTVSAFRNAQRLNAFDEPGRGTHNEEIASKHLNEVGARLRKGNAGLYEIAGNAVELATSSLQQGAPSTMHKFMEQYGGSSKDAVDRDFKNRVLENYAVFKNLPGMKDAEPTAGRIENWRREAQQSMKEAILQHTELAKAKDGATELRIGKAYGGAANLPPRPDITPGTSGIVAAPATMPKREYKAAKGLAPPPTPFDNLGFTGGTQ